ncbi:MAG: hypothetical protein SPL99_02765 [Catonella sp.]|nr:hypothetical protein [Catonella sp.]MDY6355949.1 hypothetical protein [Catonella sp.]
MQLTFTITDEDKGRSVDIRVNSAQKIEDTVKILDEAGVIDVTAPYNVFSVRKGRYVSSSSTFDEEKIYYGDILKLVKGDNYES